MIPIDQPTAWALLQAGLMSPQAYAMAFGTQGGPTSPPLAPQGSANEAATRPDSLTAATHR